VRNEKSECMRSSKILRSRSQTHQEVHSYSRSERECRAKSALISNLESNIIFTFHYTSMLQSPFKSSEVHLPDLY
jgi:hypothetical protein